ncbi:Rap1a/Tai family immunity protein [Bordetella genomosp. 10]|nr:Rap1a/Tai family immunity protein [Bordetella genomosp. 10]
MALLERRPGILRQSAALVLALTAMSAAAQPTPASTAMDETRTWHLTGAELAEALQGKGKLPNPPQDESQKRLFSSAYGQAYIAGIADQSQGKIWCTRTGVLPHELSDRVYTYLSSLPATRLRGNAGPLVGEALARSFPCKRRR